MVISRIVEDNVQGKDIFTVHCNEHIKGEYMRVSYVRISEKLWTLNMFSTGTYYKPYITNKEIMAIKVSNNIDPIIQDHASKFVTRLLYA